MKCTELYLWSMFLQYPEAYQIFRNDNKNSFTFRKQSLYQDETSLGTWHPGQVHSHPLTPTKCHAER